MAEPINETPFTFEEVLTSDKMNAKNQNDIYLNSMGKYGWNQILETWAYGSATTVIVPSNANLIYQPGDVVRLKQGAGYKYFKISDVAETILTFFPHPTYSLTDDAITDIWFSRIRRPFGMPVEFEEYTSRTILGLVRSTSLSQGFSTGDRAALSGMQTSVTVPPGGRPVRITAKIDPQNTVANDVFTLYICETSAANDLDSFSHNFVTSGRRMSMFFQTVLTPSAGSHTYLLAGQRKIGTGDFTITQASTLPALLLVELI